MSDRDEKPDVDSTLPNRRRRWLAHPAMSVVIAASWLLLQGSLEPAHLLWAAILGVLLPWAVQDFLGPGRPLAGAGVAIRLVAVVVWDILVANIAVARVVLHPGITPQPVWVRVPYTLTDARGIVLLATIITTTPGTVSCVVDEARREILVHALNADDPDAVVAEILHRYERPLKEIFG